MAVSVTCPGCANSFNVSDDLLGKKIRCKSCQEVFVAMGVTVVAGGSIDLTLWLLAGFSVTSLAPALLRAPVASELSERLALAGVAAVGAAFAGAVWWTANTIQGDGLFHLARVRKLDSFDLTSLNVLDEFRDGGLHPGYAFPLWHSAVALMAKIANVDPATALTHLPAILTPLALLLAYAAGAALFRSFGGGIAVAAGQAGLLGFSRSGTGAFDFLALPPSAARSLITPALLTLVFSFASGGRRREVLSVAAASLALAVVHPTYAFFVAVPLVGYLVARVLLATSRWREALRLTSALPAIGLPAGLYALWLSPIVSKTVSHDPDAAERTREVAHYAGQVDLIGGSLRLAPETIARGGAVVVAGLLAVPFAALAAPRRWAAYVLGGSLTILGLVLLPWTFDHLADAVSLSQARRLIAFLPIPFALAGAASLLGRLRLAGCLAAVGVGGALQLAYPGEFSYVLVVGGPTWPVWVALAGSAVGLVAGIVLRREMRDGGPIWTAAVALALMAPIAAAGFAYLKQERPDRYRLTPGLVDALRTEVPPRDVVFSDLATSYRIAAYAPVYVAAAPPAHVADTKENRPEARRLDVIKFLRTGSLSIPRRYGARWIVVARRSYDLDLRLPRAYEDSRYVLYRLSGS